MKIDIEYAVALLKEEKQVFALFINGMYTTIEIVHVDEQGVSFFIDNRDNPVRKKRKFVAVSTFMDSYHKYKIPSGVFEAY